MSDSRDRARHVHARNCAMTSVMMSFGMLATAFAAPAAGCGGVAYDSPVRRNNDAGSDAPFDGAIGIDGAARDARFDAYVDPGCGHTVPSPPVNECDPFGQGPQCGDGQACVPYVHPQSDCREAEYGATCITAGTGEQGDDCARKGECAPGYICVVSGSGNQCIRLCRLDDRSGCNGGRICEPLDVPGYGGCL